MRPRLPFTAVLAALLTFAAAGVAAGYTEYGMGNATDGTDGSGRCSPDDTVNFVEVDTNNPATVDGTFDTINYRAITTAVDVRFVVADADRYVTWISDEVTIDGVGTLELEQPVGVTEGSNIGYASGCYAAIRSGASGSAVWYQDPEPVEMGQRLKDMSTSGEPDFQRTLLLNASVTPVEAPTRDSCKDRGWEQLGFTNQGRCIASFVANDNAGHWTPQLVAP